MTPKQRIPVTWEDYIEAVAHAGSELSSAYHWKIGEAMYREKLAEAKAALLAKIKELEAKVGDK